MKRNRPSLRVFKLIGSTQDWRCAVCGKLFDEAVEIDHRIPLMQGGPDKMHNLQVLCANCHAKKTMKESVEPYMDRHGSMTCRFCFAKFSKYFRHSCKRSQSW